MSSFSRLRRLAALLSLLLVRPVSAESAGATVPPAPDAAAARASARGAATPFAVVELFTSEGCSSCPPAERLLSELAAASAPNGKNVLTLEFHVDYWNSLGWRDPFSDPAWSARQRDYARVLGSDQVYTPQLIVNGSRACVGSDRGRVLVEIDAALRQSATMELDLAGVEGDAGRVAYRVRGARDGARLCVAAVESGLVSRIGRGENSGRVLHHDSVVRELVVRTVAPADSGSIRLAWWPTRGRPARIVAFLQDPKSLAITAAATMAY